MDTIEYFRSLTAELNALKNRVRHFIGEKHWLSDGEWKESVLRAMLRRHLPVTIGVGTGFVVAPDKQTSQVDILLFDRTEPVLFQDGDFVIITPNAARGAIEVKTTARTHQIDEVCTKLAEVAEIIEMDFHQARFFGFFAYGSEGVDAERTLAALQSAAGGNSRRVIHCASVGESMFARFWGFPPGAMRRSSNHWHGYNLEGIASAYFIQNAIDHLCPEAVGKFSTMWFPEDGKEPHKVGDRPLAVDRLCDPV